GVKEEGVEVPSPADHRWPKADVYLGDGWSLAYRVLDAQYWGVPQRRARIYLVADFAGGSAGEILFKSDGLSGYSAESFRSWQRTACRVEDGTGETGRRTDPGSGDGRYCLNPQGRSGITVTEESTGTLIAQDHGNHPAVLQSAGFSTEHSAQSRSIGYEEEKSPTLRAGVVPAAMAVENHPTDGRIKIRKDGQCQTLTERMGTGGGNVPLVAEPHPSFGISKEAYASGEKANFNFTVAEEKSPTLLTREPHVVAKPRAYGVCSKRSHSMLSDNPHSGFYEAETSRTLDQSGGNPTCNQGGICIVAPVPEENEPMAFTQNQRDEVRDLEGRSGALQAQPGMKQQTFVLQGSMIGREEKNGPQGDGINEDVSFTLNTVDRHAVVTPTEDAHYSTSKNSYHTNAVREQASTLVASDYKDPPCVNDTPNDEPMYIVRRLTPVECARLQGFPDWWCDDLAIPEPTDEQIAFWTEVWETWRKLTNPEGKPKTEKQIRRWLASPYTDAAEYKLWGNGVSLPIVFFVLSGIAWAAGKEQA
ncbi:MAG: DNA cytosine methyltransferase, partial [Clostridia bacterium]|nr:DNA cytosine methyltransferase [Clostridia bacterium]